MNESGRDRIHIEVIRLTPNRLSATTKRVDGGNTKKFHPSRIKSRADADAVSPFLVLKPSAVYRKLPIILQLVGGQ